MHYCTSQVNRLLSLSLLELIADHVVGAMRDDDTCIVG